MTEAKTILRMIEAVDPGDAKTLDEIDAKIWWFLNPEKKSAYLGIDYNPQKYTRSRDALKAIRPEGIRNWNIGMGKRKTYGCSIEYDGCVVFSASDMFPTEELAELHAIISAIEYERQKND